METQYKDFSKGEHKVRQAQKLLDRIKKRRERCKDQANKVMLTCPQAMENYLEDIYFELHGCHSKSTSKAQILEQIKNSIFGLKKTANDYASQLTEVKEIAATLQMELLGYKKKLVQIEEQACQENSVTYDQNYVRLTLELERHEEMNRSILAKNKQLRSQVQELNSKLETNERNNNALRKQNQDLENIIKQIEEQMNSAEQQSDPYQLTLLQEQNSRLRAECESMKQQLHKKSKESELKAGLNQQNQVEIAKLKNCLAQLQSKEKESHKKAQQKLNQVTQKQAEINRLCSLVQELNKQLNQFKEIQAVQSQKLKCKASDKDENIVIMQNSILDYERRWKADKKEKAQLKNELQNEKRKINQKETELKQIYAELKLCKQELDKAVTFAKKSQIKAQKAQEKSQKFNEDITQIVYSHQKELNELQQLVKERSQQLSASKAQLQDAFAQIKKLQQQLLLSSNSTQKVSGAQHQSDGFFLNKLKETEAKLHETEEVLMKANLSISCLEQANEVNEKKAQEYQERLKHQKRKADCFQKTMKETQQKLQKTQKNQNYLQTKAKKADQEAQLLRKQADICSEKLGKHLCTIEQLNEELQIAYRRINQQKEVKPQNKVPNSRSKSISKIGSLFGFQ